MKSTQEHLEERAAPLASMTGDRKRLKKSTTASSEELREFMARLRGRSPQEMLGELASSNLLQGIVHAAVGCVVLIAVLTLVPYWMGGAAGPEKTSPESATDAETAAGSTAATAPATTDTAGSDDPDLERASEVMGLDETRQAAPDVNPLENNLDSLLDGVE